MKATSVYFFPNGVTACCDEFGQQIGELQEPWILLWIEFMRKKGFNPEDIKEIHLPSGRVKLFKVEDSYNWENVKI